MWPASFGKELVGTARQERAANSSPRVPAAATRRPTAQRSERVAPWSRLHGDPAQLGELGNPCFAPKTPIAGRLRSAKRQMNFGADRWSVDIRNARLKIANGGESPIHVLCVDRRREAILDVVGDFDGTFEVVAGDDLDHRSENFFAGDRHVVGHMREDRRLHEIAVCESVRKTFAAAFERRADLVYAR